MRAPPRQSTVANKSLITTSDRLPVSMQGGGGGVEEGGGEQKEKKERGWK